MRGARFCAEKSSQQSIKSKFPNACSSAPFCITFLQKSYSEIELWGSRLHIRSYDSMSSDPNDLAHHASSVSSGTKRFLYSMHDYRCDRYFFHFLVVAFIRTLKRYKHGVSSVRVRKQDLTHLKWTKFAKLLGLRAADHLKVLTSIDRFALFLKSYGYLDIAETKNYVQINGAKSFEKLKKEYERFIRLESYPRLSSVVNLSEKSKEKQSLLRQRKKDAAKFSSNSSHQVHSLCTKLSRAKEEILLIPEDSWSEKSIVLHEYVNFALQTAQKCKDPLRTANKQIQANVDFFLKLKDRIPKLTETEYADYILKQGDGGINVRVPYTRKDFIDLIARCRGALSEKSKIIGTSNPSHTEMLEDYDRLLGHALAQYRADGVQELLDSLCEEKRYLEGMKVRDVDKLEYLKLADSAGLSIQHALYKIKLNNHYLDEDAEKNLKIYQTYFQSKASKVSLTGNQKVEHARFLIEKLKNFTNPYRWNIHARAQKALTYLDSIGVGEGVQSNRSFFENVLSDGFDEQCLDYLAGLHCIFQGMDEQKMSFRDTWVTTNLNEALHLLQMKAKSSLSSAHAISTDTKKKYEVYTNYFEKLRIEALARKIGLLARKMRCNSDGIAQEQVIKNVTYAAWLFAKFDRWAAKTKHGAFKGSLDEHREYFQSINHTTFSKVYASNVSPHRQSPAKPQTVLKANSASQLRQLLKRLDHCKKQLTRMREASASKEEIAPKFTLALKHLMWYKYMQHQPLRRISAGIEQKLRAYIAFFKVQGCQSVDYGLSLRWVKNLKNLSLVRKIFSVPNDKEYPQASLCSRKARAVARLLRKVHIVEPEQDYIDRNVNSTLEFYQKKLKEYRNAARSRSPALSRHTKRVNGRFNGSCGKKKRGSIELLLKDTHKSDENSDQASQGIDKLFDLLRKYSTCIRKAQLSKRIDKKCILQVHKCRAFALDVTELIAQSLIENPQKDKSRLLHRYLGYFGSIKGWVQQLSPYEELKTYKLRLAMLDTIDHAHKDTVVLKVTKKALIESGRPSFTGKEQCVQELKEFFDQKYKVLENAAQSSQSLTKAQ